MAAAAAPAACSGWIGRTCWPSSSRSCSPPTSNSRAVYSVGMTSESRRGLSKAEFEQLLQRAAERQTLAERRDFTAAELVEAGRELGIDEETVRAVHAEHERALAQPPGRARPFDSALELPKEGDTLRLIMPAPAGRQGTAVLRILLAAGGVALIGAVGAGLPLVLVGAAIAVGVAYVSAWLGFSRAELRLRPDG